MTDAFNEEAFFRAVDHQRSTEGITWRELGRRLGLSASTFSRLSRGRRPDVDTFVKLLAWLDMPAETFTISKEPRKRPPKPTLGVIGAVLRRDPDIHPRDASALEDIVRVAYTRFRRIR
jgi:transcriptional regulator with XRE-family HTH domain